MNYAEFLKNFARKKLMGLKLFRIISLIPNHRLNNTNHALKEALRYFENHTIITNIKSRSFDEYFTSEILVSVKLLNLLKH